MKKSLLFFFLLSTINLYAQPLNDNCEGIVDLGTGISCSDAIYNNIDATVSTVFTDAIDNTPSCWNSVNQDVWFMFTVPANGSVIDYTITVEGIDDGAGNGPLMNPQIALYRGSCSQDNLAELFCKSADLGATTVSLDAPLLTPTVPYFIRIDHHENNPPGAFKICVDSLMIENNIDEGSTTACAGTLYDSGGPDGDYMSNENNVFTICPSGLINSVNFKMEFYNIERPTEFLIPDIINFYDGNTIFDDLLGSVASGGTCFQTCASSGCLTVEFISDGMLNFEGFVGSWQCSIEPCNIPLPISVDSMITNAAIIEATSTPLAEVTVDKITCDGQSIGTFISPPSSDLGLEKGIILSTGFVANAPGPNTNIASNDTGILGLNAADGDADLDILSQIDGGRVSFDACIIELDVFVNTNELTFEYIFGSEEYPIFVWNELGFNDIFAFLVSGPGITGNPNIGNQKNIAIIPNTNIPVQIDSLNDIVYSEYFRDNSDGLSINYNGLTNDFPGGKKSLTAKVQTEPCNTYHLKLAIGDRGDPSYDSAVFISDIKSGVPVIATNFGSGLDYLIEDCVVGGDELTFSLNSDIVVPITYDIILGGSATLGTDYLIDLPDSITFTPDNLSFAFPITVLSDLISEGTENITVALTSDFGCGIVQAATLDLRISDIPIVEINDGVDTLRICGAEEFQLSAEGAQFYFWEPVSAFDDPSSNNPTGSVTQSQWVSVTGNIANCVDVDSIFLMVVEPDVTIVPQTATDICQGSTVILEAVNNQNGAGLTWSPNIGVSNTNDEIVTIATDLNTVYTAALQLANCVVSDEITINVDQLDFPNLTTTDTLLCPGQELVLAVDDLVASTTTYEWTPTTGLIPDGNILAPSVLALTDMVYTVVATSENGFCSQTATVNVAVIPAEINIIPEDVAFICQGDSITINANTTSNTISWSSTDLNINGTTNLSFTAAPTDDTWYFASMMTDLCTVNDSVFVKIDSLPSDMSISATPGPAYCLDDLITFTSPPYEASNFPDIAHFWSPPLGAESAFAAYNFTIRSLESTTYTRTTINNGCTQIDTIAIEVIEPVIVLAFEDTLICPGEPTQLLVLSEVDNIVWSPMTELSCINCPDPIASPLTTTQYVVTGEIAGCPVTGSVDVRVRNAPDIMIQADPTGDIAVGELVILTAITSPDATTTGTFEWFLNEQSLALSGPSISAEISATENIFVVNLIDEFGCFASGETNIIGLPTVYDIPSAFTPDGDNTNDIFKFLTEGNIEMESFQIFNRWGQQVFLTKDIDTGWDGTFNGNAAPSDVYVYVIKFNLPGQNQQILKGDVTLIR